MRQHETAPPPYVHQSWPAFYYHPETGEGKIFQHEAEVPEGWSDDPRGHLADRNSLAADEGGEDGGNGGGQGGSEGDETFVMPQADDRAGIAAELRKREVKFNSNWKTERLYDTLVDALKPKE